MRAARCLLVVASACATADGGHVEIDAATQGDAGLPAVDAPSGVACASGATCQTAMMLGSLSGDSGTSMQMTTGYQSAWLRVRVNETDNGVIGAKLSMTARLISPSTADFDVFLYVNTAADQLECTTPSGTTTKSGNIDNVRIQWGEGTIPNGVDDSRNVSIEVRPISGPCSPSTPWQLIVTGHT
jgi:hypothetical protein